MNKGSNSPNSPSQNNRKPDHALKVTKTCNNAQQNVKHIKTYITRTHARDMVENKEHVQHKLKTT